MQTLCHSTPDEIRREAMTQGMIHGTVDETAYESRIHELM